MLFGKLVLGISATDKQRNVIDFKALNLSIGLYFLKIVDTDNRIISKKIIFTD